MITVPAERPIPFSPEMVRALLRKDNPKTQTRRIVNPQPEEVYHRARAAFDAAVRADRLLHACEVEGWHPKCPYGKPGDRLWVRESWCYWGAISDPISDSAIAFRADADMAGVRWRSPIHMHRWAARIFLEIVSVRVQRVQDITADDVLAEGVELAWGDRQTLGSDETRARQLLFGQLWDRTNGKRAPWQSNPWVWVIEFRRAA